MPGRTCARAATRRALVFASGAVIVVAGVGLAGPAGAQLVDATRIGPVVPGGAIARSLDEQVGAGHGPDDQYGTSLYLLVRDPARAIRRGRQLFQRKFTAEQGLGPRVDFTSTGDVMSAPGLGAGLVDSCAGCHGRPRGAAGFGGDVATRPDSRDAPHLFGLGLQEMLADEMTRELRALRDEAIARAAGLPPGTTTVATTEAFVRDVGASDRTRSRDGDRRRGGRGDRGDRGDRDGRRGGSGSGSSSGSGSGPGDGGFETAPDGAVTVRLVAKGVRFGQLTAHPDGRLDTSAVDGVDPDLRVRPFFHHGDTASIREFVVGAFKAEMGLEAADPVLCAATDPAAPSARVTPGGFLLDPATDRIERPPVCDAFVDHDGDGIVNEIDPALVDFMEFYLLNYFKPGTGAQTRRTREGRALLDTLACTSCHVEQMTIDVDRRVADVETVHDPERGRLNRLFATASTRFVAVDDGDPYPRLEPSGEAFVVRNLFTDFKRHDLGPAFHEREYDGTLRTEFLTEALWGVGSTAPYGHDGRSIDLEEVILRHGGEAQASRDAYARLSGDDRRKVQEFLRSLVLFPPDDTASNLNPGDPGLHVQTPDGHGRIDLGALFQIADEGGE